MTSWASCVNAYSPLAKFLANTIAASLELSLEVVIAVNPFSTKMVAPSMAMLICVADWAVAKLSMDEI